MRENHRQQFDITVTMKQGLLSVPAWAHSNKPAAAGLLLWAQQSTAAAADECGQCHVVSIRR